MKTILVPTEDNRAMSSALETALILARRCDSYMEGFALRWSVADFAAFDPTGGIPLETDRLAAARVEKQARQIFETFMQGHNVPRSTAKTETLSFGWLDDAPQTVDFVGSYGRVFDVIVMSRPDANETFVHNRALYSGLFESGRPILLAPPAPPPQNVVYHVYRVGFPEEYQERMARSYFENVAFRLPSQAIIISVAPYE